MSGAATGTTIIELTWKKHKNTEISSLLSMCTDTLWREDSSMVNREERCDVKQIQERLQWEVKTERRWHVDVVGAYVAWLERGMGNDDILPKMQRHSWENALRNHEQAIGAGVA